MKKHKTAWALCLAALLVMTGCNSGEGVVTLGEYKGHTLDKVPYEVHEHEIDDYIEQMILYTAPVVEITDRAVAEGDTVVIDYRGLLDGEAFEGGTAEGASLTIGSGQFIPGFEEGLVGVMPGESVDIPLTFPEEYHAEELAGQAVVFEVTVHYIKGEKIIPEFDDAWVAENSLYTTTEEYRAGLRASMEQELRYDAEQSQLSTLLDRIIENTTFGKLPKEQLEKRARSIKQYHENYAAMMGTDLATYLAYNGMTEADFYDWLDGIAEEAVKNELVLEAIAKAEGLTLTDEDRESYATRYGYNDYAHVLENNDAEMVEEFILAEKVEQFLLENNTFA